MSSSTQGQRDHRAVELFERCARLAREKGVAVTGVRAAELQITAAVLEDAAIRWFTERGYDMTRHDATQPAGG